MGCSGSHGLASAPLAAQFAAVQENYDFEVGLTRQTNEMLGMTVVARQGRYLSVKNVYGTGLVGNWNASVPEEEASERRVRPGDLIVGVNGNSGSPSTMLEDIKHRKFLVLLVRRARESDITDIDKVGEPMAEPLSEEDSQPATPSTTCSIATQTESEEPEIETLPANCRTDHDNSSEEPMDEPESDVEEIQVYRRVDDPLPWRRTRLSI
eukprot:TRINITY_DN49180_c0_g1_i1.p1 TRINITY_DN49180_c0_g1~~TRINITY_DN49180_c0_g1_i1.p1  ORF type:complete len:210 (+),score=31.07 TRINITY_DN49180_c0_g1_i1:102-731(+)